MNWDRRQRSDILSSEVPPELRSPSTAGAASARVSGSVGGARGWGCCVATAQEEEVQHKKQDVFVNHQEGFLS